MTMPAQKMASASRDTAADALHRIVIVGGGAGGLELATALGKQLGRRGKALVTLIDQARSHVWKPKLHEIAAGSMDVGLHEVSYRAQAHWQGFRFRVGQMIGLDRERREVHVAPFIDEDGVEVTPARSIGYDTLVIAVGSQSNDFGTPGVKDNALKLETTADARAFQRRLVNACIRAHAQQTPLAPHQLQVAIIGAGATGVELAAELHHATRELVAYGLDRIDPDKDLQLHLIEASTRVLPGLPERVSASAQQLLQSLGVQVHTSAKVAEVLPRAVRLADGREIPAELVVWAAGVKAADVDNIVAVGALAGFFSRGAQGGDIKRVINSFQLGGANGELLNQVLTDRIGDGDDVASLINAPDLLLFHPAVKTAAVSEIGRGEHAVQAKPDVAPVQQAAAGDNAVGFMQIREHQIETALLF